MRDLLGVETLQVERSGRCFMRYSRSETALHEW